MKTNYKLSQIGKRVTAFALSAVMTLSMVQIGLSADAADPLPDVKVADKGGEATAQNGLYGSKTITKEYPDGNRDTFDITLTTKGNDTITQQNKPAHVVLVLDRSGSMTTSMPQLRAAATSFANVLMGSNGSRAEKDKNQIAIVAYDHQIDTIQNFSSDLNTVRNAINRVNTRDTGFWGEPLQTLTQGGLRRAQSLINSDPNKEVDKIIVLMSDGAPTRSYRIMGGAWVDSVDRNSWTGEHTITGFDYVGSESNITKPGTAPNFWSDYTVDGDASVPGDGHYYLTDQYYSFWAHKNYYNSYLYLYDRATKKRINFDADTGGGIYLHLELDANGKLMAVPRYNNKANNGTATVAEANLIKSQGTTIYSILWENWSQGLDYTVADMRSVMQGISSDGRFLTSANVRDLAANFTKTAQQIVGVAKPTTLTDPMNENVTFLGVVENGAIVKTPENVVAPSDKNGQTLTWDLSKQTPTKTEKQGNTTINTFEMTYRVRVNRTNQFYDAVKQNTNVPTNGTTYITYDGDKKLEIPVPKVTSEKPKLTYKINYFKKNKTSGQYELAESKTTEDVDYGTKVNTPTGYKTKYETEGYKFVKGDPMEITVSAEGENEINLYYDPEGTTARIEHYYKKDVTDASGKTTQGFYPTAPQIVTTPANAYVGETLTADEQPTYDNTLYQFDKAEPSKSITLQKDGTKNVIKLYYTASVDERKAADVIVDHVYYTDRYELKDGKYELVQDTKGVKQENVESASNLKASMQYTAQKQAPIKGYEGFAAEAGNNPTITLTEGENRITLNFRKVEDNRGEKLRVLVNHHYTKDIAEVVNGAVVTRQEKNTVNDAAIEGYAGERITLAEKNSYNSELYTSSTDNAAKLPYTFEKGKNNEQVDLHYTLGVTPATTKVTVNHIYRTITEITETDANGNTTTRTETKTDDTVTNQATGLYPNTEYEAALAAKTDYVFNEAESTPNKKVTVAADGSSVINLYYDKSEKNDKREDASIKVRHIYVTKTTTMVNGAQQVVETSETVDGDTYNGKRGDTYTASAKPTHNGQTYTQSTSNDELTRKLTTAGDNGTIDIRYEREASTLKPTTYTVKYVYNTYDMVIENGKAVYPGTPTSTKGGAEVSGTGSVGEKITLDDKPEGYTAEKNNPALTQILTDGTNEYTLVYSKYNPLPQTKVTVTHHYTEKTVEANGKITEKTTSSAPFTNEYFVGEQVNTKAEPNGYSFVKFEAGTNAAATADKDNNVTVTADKDEIKLDYYYEKQIGAATTYSVQHIYVTYDANGKEISRTKDDENISTYGGRVDDSVKGIPDTKGDQYELVSAKQLENTLADPYEMTLVADADSNKIVFTYKKQLPADYNTKVTLRYEYRIKGQTTLTASTEQTLDKVAVGDVITVAEQGKVVAKYDKPENNGQTYTFVSATPESVTAEKNGEHIIVLRYEREPNTKQVPVVHEYFLSDERQGEQHGKSLTVDENTKVDELTTEERIPSYNGQTYSFTKVRVENDTIYVRYDATKIVPAPTPTTPTPTTPTPTTPSDPQPVGPTTNPDPQDPPVNIPDEPTPETDIPDEPTPETDIPDEPTPETDIPDQPTPETDIPDQPTPKTDIPDQPTPKVGVPKTGDTLGLWIALAIASAMGLALLGIGELIERRKI